MNKPVPNIIDGRHVAALIREEVRQDVHDWVKLRESCTQTAGSIGGEVIKLLKYMWVPRPGPVKK